MSESKESKAFLQGQADGLEHAANFLLRGIKEGHTPEQIAEVFRNRAAEQRRQAQ